MILRTSHTLRAIALIIVCTAGIFLFSHKTYATDNLVGHWKFDEGSGTTATDSSSYGNNGTLVGSGVSYSNVQVAPITDSNPYSLLFNGASGTGVHIPDNSSLDMTTAITALAWIYWDGTGGDNVVIDKSNMAGGDTPNYRLILKGNGKLALWNGSAAVESTGTVTANTWTLVNFTITTSHTEFFINGVSAGTGNIGLGSMTNYDLLIGRDAIGRYFHGYIDEVLIYNRVLTPEEIGTIASGDPIPTPDPTAEFVSPTPDDASSQLSYPEVNLSTTDFASGHYSLTDFDDSILGWWRFEDSADDDTELSDGTWHGDDTYDTGMFGKAGVFNGTDNYIDATLPNAVTGSFTISTWVYLNSLTWSGALVSDANGHLLQIGGGNVWQFADAFGLATAQTGEWTHVVGTYDALNHIQTLYVNGEYVSSVYSDRSILQNINIGRREDGFYIDGKIDDVMLFGRALSSDEVASLYSGADNQYDHTFTNISSGDHTFTGYVVDTAGTKVATEQRTVTLIAPVLTQVTPIPAKVKIDNAKYYFSVEGDTEGYEYLFESCGDTETIVDPENHIVSFVGLQPGNTYGDCSFEMASDTGPASNVLRIDLFTIPAPVISSGTSVQERVKNLETLGNTSLADELKSKYPNAFTAPVDNKKSCPADQILTQNLKAPSRNEKYSAYTKGIVKEAKILQGYLNRLGFDSGPEDGILGPLSDGAIKRMQKYLGTFEDGMVGPITRGLLNNSCGSNTL